MSSPSSSLSLGKKQLSFSQIEIIELPLTLGDSPSVRDGPPVSCCWDAQMRVKVNLDTFEQHRPKRRPRQSLLLSKQVRERILLKHGVSEFAIQSATQEAQRLRRDSSKAYFQKHLDRERSSRMIPTANELVSTIVW